MHAPHYIRCGYCGMLRQWPTEFPVSYYAKCRPCYRDAATQPPDHLNWGGFIAPILLIVSAVVLILYFAWIVR